MNVKTKAERVIRRLLGEHIYHPSGANIKVVAIVNDGEVVRVGDSEGGNYVYTTGYNGSDSHTTSIIIDADNPLNEFDEFYGDPRDYPVIGQISAALEAAGFDGLKGFGAGSLKKSLSQSIISGNALDY